MTERSRNKEEMTEQGIIDVLEVLSATYPNYHPDILKIKKIWKSVLQSFPDEQIKQGVQAYIVSDTSGFAPTVGQIIDKVRVLNAPESMSEAEAWGYVSRALRNSSYGAEQEFAKLPESIQRTLGSPSVLKEWAVLDEDEVQTVVSSNFMRSYRARESKRSVMEKLPVSDRVMIDIQKYH